MLHPSFKAMTITITPEQIISAAQLIVNHVDDSWQYSESQILAAVEHYLRCKVQDLLMDADWHANKDLFDFERTCDHPTCHAAPAPHGIYCAAHCGYLEPQTATELVIPQPSLVDVEPVAPSIQ